MNGADDPAALSWRAQLALVGPVLEEANQLLASAGATAAGYEPCRERLEWAAARLQAIAAMATPSGVLTVAEARRLRAQLAAIAQRAAQAERLFRAAERFYFGWYASLPPAGDSYPGAGGDWSNVPLPPLVGLSA